MLNSKDVYLLFERFEADNPYPKTELEYKSSFTLMVAVVLSAQATDKMVNKITHELFKVADTPEKIVELGEEELKKYIKSINYFNNKAKNIVNISKTLIDKYNSEVPNTFDELVSLHGIGVKSANVILNTFFNHNTIAVDTHVFRVSNRLGLCQTKKPEETEKALLRVVPEKFLRDAHHWLVLHGRYICKARKPLCKECKMNDLCMYYNLEKH